MSRKLFFSALALVVCFALVAPDFRPAAAQQMQLAQAQKKRPGLFERLFGPRVEQPQRAAPQQRAQQPQRKRTTTTAAPTRKRTTSRPAAAAPAVKAVEVEAKDPNAHKILVVGDFTAAAVAWGLDQSLAKERMLAVISRNDGASGLVRIDHYDWNARILDILNEETPDIVVVALGANDRQELRDGNQRHPVRSETWESGYAQRIDGVVDTLRVYGRPFFWVSAPPIKGSAATADMAYINGLFRPRVEKAGGYYVDAWNGFTNASGEYITTGPDTEGQVKALRTSDGVNYTSAGKVKLAYYVERDIRRATGLGSGSIELLASVTQASTIEVGPDGKKRLVGPVISLSDPPPGAGLELAGPPDPVIFDPASGKPLKLPVPVVEAPAEEDETPQYRLVVRGEAPPTVVGRADDFTWPPNRSAGDLFAALQVPEDEVVAEDADGEAVLTTVSESSE